LEHLLCLVRRSYGYINNGVNTKLDKERRLVVEPSHM
jgi:hypothetical protein